MPNSKLFAKENLHSYYFILCAPIGSYKRTFLSGLAISGRILQNGFITSKNLTEMVRKNVKLARIKIFLFHFYNPIMKYLWSDHIIYFCVRKQLNAIDCSSTSDGTKLG